MLRFRDEQLQVFTGIDMGQEANIDASHDHRDLTDSIKIFVHSQNVRFIQFVTRLAPDVYEFRTTNGVTQQWDPDLPSIETHYMTSDNQPRWKIDTTPDSETCFYDENGANVRNEHGTAMYDCPGGIAELEEERVIFCTFVIVDESVTHKVKWSKQFDTDRRPFYSIEVQPCQLLPNWAIRNIVNDYAQTNGRTFESLPATLMEGYDAAVQPRELNVQSWEDFLPAPEQWITRQQYPLLFIGPPQPAINSNPQ